MPRFCFLFVLAVLLAAPAPAQGREADLETKIAPWLLERLDEGRTASFIVRVDGAEVSTTGVAVRSAGHSELYRRLTRSAEAAQRGLREALSAAGVEFRQYYLVNAIKVNGDLALARALARRPDVERIVGNPQIRVHDPVGPGVTSAPSPDGVEWGVEMVRAPDVWNGHGTTGEGIVVASMDTGVEWDHPALRDAYRGWDSDAGSADHAYSWHDAVADVAQPLDDNGHGTHTTGTMVGDDGEGNQVGVAPGARWIACRNMDSGVGTPALYLDCMEWTFAPYPPGGDPFTDGRPELAPHVVNNSWGCPPSEGCDPGTLREAFARMRQAGIWQVAAAGNSGPTCGSVQDPPAIYEESFGVGAVSASRTLAFFSSRGPVRIDGSDRLKPNVSAPGEGVRSATRGGGYGSASGTSMAAPHVAGVSALLWSAKPELEGLVDLSRCLLERSASTPVNNFFDQTCAGIPGDQYPNGLAGWGIVDAAAALELPNGDGDAVADPCDCAASDAGAFDEPIEVSGMTADAADPDRWSWSSQAERAGGGTVYDLLRGDVTTLREDAGLDDAECEAENLDEPTHEDATAPAPGRSFYYLPRARNACGDGGYGSASDGTARQSAECPS